MNYNELRTSSDWYIGYQEKTGITIIDPDGWDRENWCYSMSTCLFEKPKIEDYSDWWFN